MQEEKNQQQNGERKKHKNHRHGYFIQPPTGEAVKQGERASTQQSAPQAQQKQNNSKPNPPRQGGESTPKDKPAGENQARGAHQGGRNNHYRKRNHNYNWKLH